MNNIPGRQVVVLVRDACRATLSFDPDECRAGLIKICNILMDAGFASTVDDVANRENTWTNKLATLHPATFNETGDIICAGALHCKSQVT
jgi:hypothetical protein